MLKLAKLRKLLDRDSDTGLGMTEVVVALMVFSVIAVGMAYSLISMTRLTTDDRAREVAASLASQEIDIVRAIPDPFDVHTPLIPATQTVGNTTYTITRSVAWVSTTGSTANCGTGGGNLQYKKVNVSVTWNGMMSLQNPVVADTILSPATRLNDPSYGTILVSVLGADGTGRSGVSVSVTATSGGAAVGAVDPTDIDGCAYVLQVTPGTYSVKLSKTGYIDYNQIASPSLSVTVAAGTSQTANFAYDSQATYNVKYASGYVGAKLPATLTTNYLSSKGAYSTTSTATPISLYPLSEGYAAVAGSYASTSSTSSGCLAVDPVNWAASTYKGVSMAQGVRQVVGVAPGGTGSINVPMGVVAVKVPTGATSFLAHGGVDLSGTGDPGCAQPTDYKFTWTTAPTAGSTVYLALPFGTWTISSLNAAQVESPMSSGFSAATTGYVNSKLITLDPRVAG